MPGIKLEDRQALDRAAETLFVPGLVFAEYRPRDFGISFGHREGRAYPPLPPEVVPLGEMVRELPKGWGTFFQDSVLPESVIHQAAWRDDRGRAE